MTNKNIKSPMKRVQYILDKK